MKRIKSIIAISVLLMFAAGCSNDFEEMNINPVQPTGVEGELLLAPMQRAYIDGYQVNINLFSNQYAQYVACTKAGWITDRYGSNSGWVSTAWRIYYVRTLGAIREMERQWADNPTQSNKLNIARIVKVYVAQLITDYWGDVPYFEAGNGDDKLPYDSQESIYKSFFKELTDAQNALSNSPDQSSYGTYDMIYQGDPVKWKKYANTLRLRMAIRLSNVAPELAKQEGEAAIKDGVFTSNDDNADWWSDQTKDDFGGFQLINISFWGEFRLSSSLESVYKQVSSVVDPRLAASWHPTEANPAIWKGVDNGLMESELANINAQNSNVGGTFFTATTENLHIGYPEACFLLAEAAWRGWNGAGDAQTHYDNGMAASFAYFGIPPADYHAYISGGDVPFASDKEKQFEQIITQKYIALFPDGPEAWSEFRRTGLPKYLKPVANPYPGSVNQGEFIKKIRYIDNEYEFNNANVTNPALNGGKGDGVHVRVWWDTGKYK
jgi:hypothetical protein